MKRSETSLTLQREILITTIQTIRIIGDKRSNADVWLIEIHSIYITWYRFLLKRYSRFYRDSISQLWREYGLPFHQGLTWNKEKDTVFYIIFHVLFIIFVELGRRGEGETNYCKSQFILALWKQPAFSPVSFFPPPPARPLTVYPSQWP